MNTNSAHSLTPNRAVNLRKRQSFYGEEMGIQTNDNNVFKKKKEKGTGRLVLGKDRPVVLQKTQKRLEETKREKSLAKETGKRE